MSICGSPALTRPPCACGVHQHVPSLLRPFPLATRVRCGAGPGGDGRTQSTRVLDSSSAKARPSRQGLCSSVWSADQPLRPTLRVSQVPRVPFAGSASSAVRTLPKLRTLAGSSAVSGLAERGVSGNPRRLPGCGGGRVIPTVRIVL